MQSIRYLLFFLLICTISGCAKKLDTYNDLVFMQLLQEADPHLEIVFPKSTTDEVSCSLYGPGCIRGKRVMIRKVVMTIIQYDTTEHARHDAFVLNQYYLKNWLLDDVRGEPVLVDFVKSALHAENPQKF